MSFFIVLVCHTTPFPCTWAEIPENKHKIGVYIGRQFLILPVDQKFVVDILAWKDHTKEGLKMAENIDLIEDIMLKLSHIQSQKIFLCTIQPNNKNLLKQKLVLVQGTMAKRTGITVYQEFEWMKK